MNLDKSGIIFKFDLQFDLGFCYCRYDDYTDLSTFSGNVLTVFDQYNIDIINEVESLASAKKLFGPVSTFAKPSIRGVKKWKKIGRLITSQTSVPQFKYQHGLLLIKDWETVKPWFVVTSFSGLGRELPYPLVRELERTILYSMYDIEIRSTMHYLLQNNKKVNDYYDLSNLNNWFLYADILNTSLSYLNAKKYLEEMPGPPKTGFTIKS